MCRRRFLHGVWILACGACHAAVVPTGVAPRPADQAVAPAALTQRGLPRDAARFEIDAVGDSTVRFRPMEARWVRDGLRAWVVDPLRRDALIARLQVQGEQGGAMTALITSQVGRVTTSHFVLVARPPTPWWRERAFWAGAAAGGAIGAAARTLIR